MRRGRIGSCVVLQPERINACAQAVIRTLQADEHQRGCLMEERGLKGDLAYESLLPWLAGDEERLVLLAMHQTLVGEGAGPRLIELDGNGHGQYPPGRERLFSGAKERCRFQ